MKIVTTFAVTRGVALGIMLVCVAPAMLAAQTRALQNPTPPKTLSEPRGFVTEPDVIERAAIFSDRRLGNDELSNGWRVGFADLAPGAGWLSGQTTYRRWAANDRHVAEASAGFSIHGYSAIAGRFEYLALAERKVSVGAAFRRQDYSQVPYFGSGPDTREADISQYRLESSDLVGYVTAQPARYLDLNLTIGLLNPDVHRAAGLLRHDHPDTRDRYAADPLFALASQPSFVTSAVALTSDSRDFPGRSLRGGIVRMVATRYSDRNGGTASFRRYEAEIARFVPFASERIVLAMHGRLVGSDTGNGQFVPFYLQPNLGGQRSLRSYESYRFHDRNLASLSVETRVALMTHLDTAFFIDAGNVAARAGDLNLEKRSYGAGLRLHTRRHTFARVDVAHGSEGWRAVFQLDDPLALARLKRQTTLLPAVP